MPTGNIGAGILTALVSDDAAAGVLVAQGGKSIVQAFCLNCGRSWFPRQLYLSRAVKGEFGEPTRARARRELERIAGRGTGFKLVSEEDQRMARWAADLLESSTG